MFYSGLCFLVLDSYEFCKEGDDEEHNNNHDFGSEEYYMTTAGKHNLIYNLLLKG